MHEINYASIGYYTAVWIVAFLAAFTRAVRDNEFVSLGHCCSLSATAGLLSFSLCCLFLDYLPGAAGNSWAGLGVSALFGLLSKEQDKYAKAAGAFVFDVIRAALIKSGSQQDNDPK